MSRASIALAWILQILVAAIFLLAGGSKLAGSVAMVNMFHTIGWGQWFRYATGVIEVGSALLLLVPSAAAFAALALICTMAGAIIAHLTVLNSPPTGPIILLCLSSAVAWLRRPSV